MLVVTLLMIAGLGAARGQPAGDSRRRRCPRKPTTNHPIHRKNLPALLLLMSSVAVAQVTKLQARYRGHLSRTGRAHIVPSAVDNGERPMTQTGLRAQASAGWFSLCVSLLPEKHLGRHGSNACFRFDALEKTVRHEQNSPLPDE